MGTVAYQITSITIVYSTVHSDADQSKHQSSASLAFVREFTVDRWIPRTNGQLRVKWFHLMTSSCMLREASDGSEGCDYRLNTVGITVEWFNTKNLTYWITCVFRRTLLWEAYNKSKGFLILQVFFIFKFLYLLWYGGTECKLICKYLPQKYYDMYIVLVMFSYYHISTNYSGTMCVLYINVWRLFWGWFL